jgi:rsbT co-antagonist protein RsbR
MTDQHDSLESEKTRLEAEIVKRKAELASKRELCEVLFERAEDSIVVFGPDGSSRTNPATDDILKTPPERRGVPDPDWQKTVKFSRIDNGEPIQPQDLAGFRVMRGHVERMEEEIAVLPSYLSEPIFVSSGASRLADGGSLIAMRDIGTRVRAERELAARNARLAEEDAEHRTLIARLRVALSELATPVLQVADGVLVLPIIGVLDTERSMQITERLLDEVVRTRASRVIIDVTGVEVMDTATADRFAKLARGVSLLGARCCLSGVHPAVAQTLVALDVNLDAMTVHRNLAHALATADKAAKSKAMARRQVAR